MLHVGSAKICQRLRFLQDVRVCGCLWSAYILTTLRHGITQWLKLYLTSGVMACPNRLRQICPNSIMSPLTLVSLQARSELRFWRGAEVDIVQNPKQLYVIKGKVRKIVSFCQRLKKLVILLLRRRQKLRFLRNFWRLRLISNRFYAGAVGTSENCSIFCRRAVFLMHLEEKAAQIVDLFARLGGGVLEHPQHPPPYGPA